MKKVIFLMLFVPMLVQGQVITTIAGNGYGAPSSGGYTGDNGMATDAELYQPTGVAVDNAGNVYIADNFNGCIRKVAPTGIITTIAGMGIGGCSGDGGTATAAKLGAPYDVAVDIRGNIYIADEACKSIRKVNASGIITTVAGNGIAGYSGDGIPATNASLYNAQNIALDSAGNIYIADLTNHRIRKVDTFGFITTVAGNGNPTSTGDGGLANVATLAAPYSVALDGLGNIYIGDYNRVRKVGQNGIITTIAGQDTSGYGGDNGPATSAKLSYLLGVKADRYGNVYIADAGNDRVRKVSPSGIITTIAGNGVPAYGGDGGDPTQASLWLPYNVALTASGNIIIADADANRVRLIRYDLAVNNVSDNEERISIYPNPASTSLTIRSVHQPIVSLAIMNVLGQTVYSQVCNAGQLQVDILALPKGVYIARINNNVLKEFVKY